MALSAPSQSKTPQKIHNSAPPGESVLSPPTLGRAGGQRTVPRASVEKLVRPPAGMIAWWWRWRGL
jgi:hypothetical protein